MTKIKINFQKKSTLHNRVWGKCWGKCWDYRLTLIVVIAHPWIGRFDYDYEGEDKLYGGREGFFIGCLDWYE